ncbi:MAG: SDR family NAD(P)-dependent oxidoreductase [Acidobacteriota bacterium]|nr:SDR family NAD(P)-dependent oxidoreductase [Acidobacteriota bacterium]
MAPWKPGGSDDNRVVLVTGTSKGIGLALAHALTRGHKRLVLTARASSLDRLAEAGIQEDERVMVRALDVTHGEQANALVAEVEARWGGVDVLVNNAAICYRAVMEHLADEHEEDQFHTNYLGPLHLVRLVLPGMRARRRGHIINLSSVGGMMAMPTMGGYSASKFALEGASEALWYELRPWNIRVTLVEPGFVHSDSFKNALFTPRSEASYGRVDDEYHAYYTNLIGLITRMMNGSPTTPEDIARIIIETMDRRNPPLRRSATWDAVFFSMMRRLLPQRLYHLVLYRGLPNIRRWVPSDRK